MTILRWRACLLLLMVLAVTACQPGRLTATPPAPVATAEAGVTPVATNAAPTAAPTEGVDGPAYALALRAALAACESAGRDQVCYGAGDVTLTAQPGATLPAFAQPGDVVDLADVAGLRLGGGDAWGLAVLRLQAGLDDPAQNLTVVAMGAAEITGLTTVVDDAAFEWGIAAGDLTDLATAATPAPQTPSDLPAPSALEPLQSLTFTNQPAADDAAPSGLFLLSPWEGDMAAVEINGAAIALGSMAFIQTEPGGAITVGMFEGGSLVTVGEATFSVPAGAQSTLPAAAPAPAGDVTGLDPRAAAIANAVAQYGLEPSDPRADAISQAVAQYGQATDPRADAISAAVAQYGQNVARYYVQQYRRAIRRCTSPANARYVYNVLYWDNKLDTVRDTPELAAVLGANGLAALLDGARRCLSFELDFSSTVTVTSAKVSYVVEVKAEAVKLQYANTGFLAQAEDGVITHVRFEVMGDEGGCPSTNVVHDGTLQITGGFLKVYYNELEVQLNFWPDVEPEQVVYSCPNAPLPLLFPWFSVFAQAHMEEFFDGVFRFYDWTVSENEHFAETIYDTDVPMDELSGHVTTYMVLVHTPQAAP